MTSSWHVHLPQIGLLSLSGQDAVKFIQGQATCDFLNLRPGHTTLGAFCTAKGRAFCVFRALRTEDRILLMLPVELLEAVRKRLSLYVLRSDVKIEDVSASWKVLGLCGEQAGDALKAFGMPPLEQDNEAEGQSGSVASLYMIRVSDVDYHRYLALVETHKSEGISRFLESHDLPLVESNLWHLKTIRAGVPEVFSATVEEFVPQMLNLDLLGGISFKKGCYTGQEIVARTYYLGQLKRRMFRLSGAGHPRPIPGDNIEIAKAVQPAGIVVSCATVEGDGFELLAVMNISATQEPNPPLKTSNGIPLNLSTLPYNFPPAPSQPDHANP